MSRDETAREMMDALAVVGRMGDRQLVDGLRVTVQRHRSATAHMLAHIGEVDARGLYRGEACSSMFAFCVERLHMSEPGAARRIHAARVARRFPDILAMVAGGELHLSGIKLLAPHLTAENHAELLAEARYVTKREDSRTSVPGDPGAHIDPASST